MSTETYIEVICALSGRLNDLRENRYTFAKFDMPKAVEMYKEDYVKTLKAIEEIAGEEIRSNLDACAQELCKEKHTDYFEIMQRY